MSIGKKIGLQNRIDREGVKIFNNILPTDKRCTLLFREEKEDYGIDGEIQDFKNEDHTGDFLKVQIKSQKEARYIEEKSYITIALDIDSIYFLMEECKDPVALILVDTQAKKVFWHPVQIDNDLRKRLNERINEGDLDKAKKPTLTIRVDVTNELNKKNYSSLLDYIEE
jgi:hypothetical protein